MEFNNTFTATLAGVKATKAEPQNLVTAKLVTKIERSDETHKLFGQDFYRTMFGTMMIEKREDGVEVPVHGYAQMILKETLEAHTIKILGHEFTVTPVLHSLTPVKGERAVHLAVTVQFQANQKNRAFVGQLFQKFDTQFEVMLSPAQGTLDFAGKDDGDDDDDESESPERTPSSAKRTPGGVVVNVKGPFGNPQATVVGG